jgi:hypothetical protein
LTLWDSLYKDITGIKSILFCCIYLASVANSQWFYFHP